MSDSYQVGGVYGLGTAVFRVQLCRVYWINVRVPLYIFWGLATAAARAAPGRTPTSIRRPLLSTAAQAASGSAETAWRPWSRRGSSFILGSRNSTANALQTAARRLAFRDPMEAFQYEALPRLVCAVPFLGLFGCLEKGVL